MSKAVSASTTPVNTGKVANRRKLHFDSLDQLLAEVDRLVDAERKGRLRRLGNWTLGQTLGHLATWTEYGYTSCPLKVPFFIRWILRLQKKKWLRGPLPAGKWIPGVEGGTLGTDPLPLDEALPRFRRAIERLKTEPPTEPSPAIGMLTHDEAIALNLRHAELHLGFFVPEV
jgi:hypothetical protein